MASFMSMPTSPQKGSKKPLHQDHMDTHLSRAAHRGQPQSPNNSLGTVGTGGISAQSSNHRQSTDSAGPPTVRGVGYNRKKA